MTSGHRSCSHPPEAELLRLALEAGRSVGPGPPDSVGESRIVLCERCEETRSELEAFVSRCREATADPEPSRGFVAAVLAQTTRENLGWRGDLVLIRGFVGQGLRESRLVRVAAASLLAHLLALPVLAWIALSGPERESAFRTGIEPWSELSHLPPVESEPDYEVEFPAADESELVEPLLDLGKSTAVSREAPRSALEASSLPAVAASATDPLARVLNARSRLAHEGEFDETVLEVLEAEDLLVRSLALEVLLDRHATGAVTDVGARGVWSRLQRDLALFAADGAGAADGPRADERALAQAVLSRARSYGLLGPATEGGAQGVPLGLEWREVLHAALARRAERSRPGFDRGDTAIVSAWIAWARGGE